MKVFIGGELEHSISDKFRKARNSVIEYIDCLCDIITNHTLLEMGQPMHAFDLNKVAGRTIDVRRAHEGEKIVTLDEKDVYKRQVDARATEPWLENLTEALAGRKPDYLVVSHMEPPFLLRFF